MVNSIPNIPRFISSRNPIEVLSFFENVMELAQEDGVVRVNASDLRFVDPFGLCLLSAFCDRLRTHDAEIELCSLPHNIQSYLSRMDLFRHCCRAEHSVPFVRADCSSSLTEISCLDSESQIQEAAGRLGRSVAGDTPGFAEDSVPDPMTCLRPHEPIESNLEYIFNELLSNSLTHARRLGFASAKVWVSSQYYPSNDIVRIGIVDSGCGFLGSLQRHSEAPATSEDAIRLALRPTVSCNRDVGLTSDAINEGIGLSTVNMMVQDAQGEIGLLSGDCFMTYTDSSSYVSNTMQGTAWDGAGIYIEISRHNLLNNNLVTDVIETIRSEFVRPSADNLIQFI